MTFDQGTDAGLSLRCFSDLAVKDRPHDLARQLETTLHRQIPLTRAMQLHVQDYDGRELRVRAPLGPNVNHHTTAFGGSLAAATTLAGWGMVWILLQERFPHGQIVIQESAISYVRPVTNDFVAVCQRPGEKAVKQLFTMLERKGKGRIDLHAEVMQAGRACVNFRGRYVVMGEPGHGATRSHSHQEREERK
jgi:thioesterase domain-containing protein